MIAPRSRRLASLDAVLLGGAATPAPVLAQATEAGISVVRTYGMSETSGGCVYDGIPLSGAQIRIDDGRVLLGGPMLASGYRGLPDHPAFAEPGWFRTDDAGAVVDGVLRISGRLDEAISTGGLTVVPQVVEACVGRSPRRSRVRGDRRRGPAAGAAGGSRGRTRGRSSHARRTTHTCSADTRRHRGAARAVRRGRTAAPGAGQARPRRPGGSVQLAAAARLFSRRPDQRRGCTISARLRGGKPARTFRGHVRSREDPPIPTGTPRTPRPGSRSSRSFSPLYRPPRIVAAILDHPVELAHHTVLFPEEIDSPDEPATVTDLVLQGRHRPTVVAHAYPADGLPRTLGTWFDERRRHSSATHSQPSARMIERSVDVLTPHPTSQGAITDHHGGLERRRPCEVDERSRKRRGCDAGRSARPPRPGPLPDEDARFDSSAHPSTGYASCARCPIAIRRNPIRA